MQPEANDVSRTTIPVIPRIPHKLIIRSYQNSPPHMSRIIRLKNLLRTVSQPAVAQNKSEAAQGEIPAVIARNPVDDKRRPHFVLCAMPRLPAKIGPDLRCPVNLCISKRFIRAFIPSQPSKRAPQRSQFLLRVQAETVFHPALLPIQSDIGNRVLTG